MESRINLRDKHQLHMRPVQVIVETASRYKADIRAVKGHLNANAKSIVEMLEFAAYMVNQSIENDDDEFVLKADGDDAEAALNELNALIDKRFDLEPTGKNKTRD